MLKVMKLLQIVLILVLFNSCSFFDKGTLNFECRTTISDIQCPTISISYKRDRSVLVINTEGVEKAKDLIYLGEEVLFSDSAAFYSNSSSRKYYRLEDGAKYKYDLISFKTFNDTTVMVLKKQVAFGDTIQRIEKWDKNKRLIGWESLSLKTKSKFIYSILK